MKHTIDLKNYQLRTDLINEVINDNKIEGLIQKEKVVDEIKIKTINVLEKGSQIIKKKPGTYITLEFLDITDTDNKNKVKEIFSKTLYDFLKENKIDKNDKCLIVGLGNIKSTPDSLGPLTINNIVVTNHLFELEELKGFRRVSAINPGVTGSTGIETSNLIKSIINEEKPDFLIVIDALASGSIERVNKTIQMCNTGIAPGSGIGNSRKEISYDTVNIPVIAIGVPTVVDAVTVVSDTFNYMYKHYAFNKKFINDPMSKLTIGNINYLNKKIEINNNEKKQLLGLIGELNEEETKSLLYEVLTPIGYNLMVTPKEVDFIIEKLTDVIGNGINRALHENFKE